MTDDQTPSPSVPASPPNVLQYSSVTDMPGVVRIGSVVDPSTAQLLATILEGNGIPCALQNMNSSAIYGSMGFLQIHLEVPGPCAKRAAELLHGLFENPDAVEPEPDGPPTEENATAAPPQMVIVAAFEDPRAMREAAAILGSANIPVRLPRLTARGDRPAGVGPRFIVKVEEEDADRARVLLDRAKREAEEERVASNDDPHCPSCDAWRVFRHIHYVGNLLRFFTGRSRLPDEWECLACGHRWNGKP